MPDGCQSKKTRKDKIKIWKKKEKIVWKESETSLKRLVTIKIRGKNI